MRRTLPEERNTPKKSVKKTITKKTATAKKKKVVVKSKAAVKTKKEPKEDDGVVTTTAGDTVKFSEWLEGFVKQTHYVAKIKGLGVIEDVVYINSYVASAKNSKGKRIQIYVGKDD